VKQKFHNLVVFDVETGGLDKKNNFHAICHPITQIALLGLNGLTLDEITRYSSYIKGRTANNKYIGYSTLHDQEYQPGALQHTGITIQKLEAEGQDAKVVAGEICDFFESCMSGSAFHKIILCGHNVGYDIPFIQYLFKLYKKDISKYVQGYFSHTGEFVPANFDTQFLSRVKSTDENLKHNLTDMSFREGVELTDAHEAMNDVIATTEVLKKYIRTLRNSEDSGEKQEVEKFRSTFQFEY
jgi:DNA polymerase III epsilon subunit-like protein